MRFDSLKSLRVLFALAAVFALVAAAACTTETVKEVPVEVVVEKEVVKEVMVPAAGPGAAEIAAIVEKAVQAAVPKGTSPEEISRLVEAAVAGATADVPTKGELEASIAKSVKDAAAAQLTAADVEKIVDASVSAVVEEVAEAAAMAAGKAVELSIVKLPEGVREERAGFQRVNVPEVERPTNIKADLTLEPVQELSYVYNSAAQGGYYPRINRVPTTRRFTSGSSRPRSSLAGRTRPSPFGRAGLQAIRLATTAAPTCCTSTRTPYTRTAHQSRRRR